MISRRIDPFLMIALLSLAAVAFALASQHLFDMPPCAWCVFQRLIYLAIAVVCLVLKSVPTREPWVQRGGGGLVVLMATGGIAAAWYQYTVAANMFSCDQTFADRFMVSSGLDASLPWLFGIYATCMEARVDLLGVEYALWSLALFGLVALGGLWAAIRPPTNTSSAD